MIPGFDTGGSEREGYDDDEDEDEEEEGEEDSSRRENNGEPDFDKASQLFVR